MGATPWALTDNFIAALREGRGRLALTGAGDPTGRGIGFSLLRDARKARPTLPYPSTRPALLVLARASTTSVCSSHAQPEACGPRLQVRNVRRRAGPVLRRPAAAPGVTRSARGQAAGAADGAGPAGKAGAGGITGTNADLRRLNMAASKQILLSLGVGEAEIDGARPLIGLGLDRVRVWHQAVRALSGATALGHGRAALTRGARAQD